MLNVIDNDFGFMQNLRRDQIQIRFRKGDFTRRNQTKCESSMTVAVVVVVVDHRCSPVSCFHHILIFIQPCKMSFSFFFFFFFVLIIQENARFIDIHFSFVASIDIQLFLLRHS